MDIWEKKKRFYQKHFDKYGNSPKALAYWSKKSIDVRNRELLADIDIRGRSILDVGCGFGDIIPFLAKKAEKFEYLGIDLVPEFIGEARKKYLEQEFRVGNYFEKPLRKKFDIIVTSGTLNSTFPKGTQIAFRKRAIGVMWKHANEALAFNMAGSHPQPKNSRKSKIYYADSMEIVKYCLTLTSKIILRQNYLPKDFTIILFK